MIHVASVIKKLWRCLQYNGSITAILCISYAYISPKRNVWGYAKHIEIKINGLLQVGVKL